MTATPYAIPHTTEDINNAISKVVSAQKFGELTDDNELVQNSIVKDYVDSQAISSDLSFSFATYSVANGSSDFNNISGFSYTEVSDPDNIGEIYAGGDTYSVNIPRVGTRTFTTEAAIKLRNNKNYLIFCQGNWKQTVNLGVTRDAQLSFGEATGTDTVYSTAPSLTINVPHSNTTQLSLSPIVYVKNVYPDNRYVSLLSSLIYTTVGSASTVTWDNVKIYITQIN
jgi:hypothetical protein